MKADIDVLIIGGGIAGLTAAIHLSKVGINVMLIEKNQYPCHKVCGEYVSNEVLPYLQWLDADPEILKPTQLSKLQITTISGKSIETHLPLGGFGISRSSFDEFLYNKATDVGCIIVKDTVENVVFKNNTFTVSSISRTYQAEIVIAAYGKRAAIDHQLGRSFIKMKSPWLAVKAHYTGDFPNDLVALHNFPGGYCGISKVENDLINICYLVDYKSFKSCKNIIEHQKKVLYQNSYLKNILKNSDMLFKSPLTISQISFHNKEKINSHILMIGDTAGLIHPLCGNGMAMAIHSASICAKLVIDYFTNKISSREILEQKYETQWNNNFKTRINTGKLLSNILRQRTSSNILMGTLIKFPKILPAIIKKTHGEPLKY